jgi:hypothetical protein
MAAICWQNAPPANTIITITVKKYFFINSLLPTRCIASSFANAPL